MTTLEECNRWLSDPEGLNLEFKAARNQYGKKELWDYCAALATEGGGKFLLGVDDVSRKVVGSNAFHGTHQTLSHEIFQNTEPHLRVDVQELEHPDGRVIIFHIPARPTGCPIRSNGGYTYPMRLGESLKEMDNETLRRIHSEIEEDFSAHIVPGMALADLDERALADFRRRRVDKIGNPSLTQEPIEQLLRDVHLITDQGCTYACLVLLGTEASIQKFLPQYEIIYEWRGASIQTHHDFRDAWKTPYFSLYDKIWKTINDRNIRTPYQEGFVQREIWSFDEKSCREAVNNAVCHRDYALPGSVYILASPASLIVMSPGGFPSGITPDNVMTHAPAPRNRLIAEALEHTGIVERSGQGVNDIYEASIRQGKGFPSFEGTDPSQVSITIPANVQDTNFVRFIERAINEKQVALSVREWVELESIRVSGKVSSPQYRKKFMELGLIEQHGKTRGAKYILSHRYYTSTGLGGVHTRLTGLPREARRKLILQHIEKNGRGHMNEFRQTFPDMQPMDISNLLQELRRAGLVERAQLKGKMYWILSKKLDINPSKLEQKVDTNGFSKPN